MSPYLSRLARMVEDRQFDAPDPPDCSGDVEDEYSYPEACWPVVYTLTDVFGDTTALTFAEFVADHATLRAAELDTIRLLAPGQSTRHYVAGVPTWTLSRPRTRS